ncbi:MAG: hypothetical protein ABL977_04940 [Candidatus Eisenbacteria bacterium]
MTRSERVGGDTPGPAQHTRARWRRACTLLALALLCSAPSRALAELRLLDAHVVWRYPGGCYLASDDTTLFTPGLVVSIERDGQVLATGRIEPMHEPRLAAVRLESGSLDALADLSSLRVRGESARDVRMTRLRVGLPSATRHHPLIACDRAGLRTEFAHETYEAHGDRLLRRLNGPTLPVAPDTIDVTWFTDAADADIAIARGELDVAVFWPGELPARLRAPEHAANVLAGERAHGVLAAEFAAADTLPLPPSDLAWLAHEAFAGDARVLDTATGTPVAARYRVDPALPAAAMLERVLARVNRASAKRTVTLRWLDDAAPAAAGVSRPLVPVLVPVCRVVSAPGARASVRAIGASAFADLPECARVPR